MGAGRGRDEVGREDVRVSQDPTMYLDLLSGCPVWRSLSSVGASIGDPFEGAGISILKCSFL